NELGFSPALWGGLVSVGGIGAVLGAFLAVPAARRFGAGPSIIACFALTGAATMLIPLAGGPVLLAVAYIGTAQLFGDTVAAIYSVNERSLRQSVTPDHLLGRAGATLEFLSAGIALLGAIVGGILGEIIGVRLTIAVGAAAVILGSLWMLFSPVRSLRSITEAAIEVG
ncbi:MAG TPA: MFS transporter, partial [Chloroflexia bacterium]|nr:MFS transporter [Chloroflexia bacterium]